MAMDPTGVNRSAATPPTATISAMIVLAASMTTISTSDRVRDAPGRVRLRPLPDNRVTSSPLRISLPR
jgi:hypothetical protein